VLGAVKVNNNRLLEDENLAFIECALVVDDVEVVEVDELLSTMT
jgi:hypothetical protein